MFLGLFICQWSTPGTQTERDTAKSRQVPGTPFKWCSPRSSNAIFGSHDEVLDRGGHEGLAGVGLGHDARAEVDRDASDVALDEVDLPRVQARSHVDADSSEALVDRFGASDGASGSVEGREESVTRRLHLSSFEPVERPTDELVMLGEELAPSGVSDLGRAVGRADDIGEEHGREHAVVPRSRPGSRDEVLDLAQQRILVARPQQAASARQLDVRCAGDVLSQVAAVPGVDRRIRPSDDERRDPDGRQDPTDVRRVDHVDHRGGSSRAHGMTLVAPP